LTFPTVCSRLVGSNVDRSGVNSGSRSPYFRCRNSCRKTMSSEPTRMALMPRSGREACTCLPVTVNLSQRMCFSAISTSSPRGVPWSGTKMMSPGLKTPSCRRNRMPFSFPASSSATRAMPSPLSNSTPVLIRVSAAKRPEMMACPLSSAPSP